MLLLSTAALILLEVVSAWRTDSSPDSLLGILSCQPMLAIVAGFEPSGKAFLPSFDFMKLDLVQKA